MRLDPSMTAVEIEPLLRHQAEQLYGSDRAQELSERIAHLASVLAAIASRELSIRDVPPDITGITDWRGV
jgi:hypothetical protein